MKAWSMTHEKPDAHARKGVLIETKVTLVMARKQVQRHMFELWKS